MASLTIVVLGSASAFAGNVGLMGALLGAGAGAAIGHSVDRTGGSGKGAVIGGIGGYLIGKQLEKKDPPPPTVQKTTQWVPPENPQPVSQQQGDILSQNRCSRGKADFEQAQRQHNPEDKVFFLEKASHYCPDDARIHNDLGVAYYKRGNRHDRERAKGEFNQALRLKPDYQVAQNNLRTM